jgi:hypothetical protein
MQLLAEQDIADEWNGLLWSKRKVCADKKAYHGEIGKTYGQSG